MERLRERDRERERERENFCSHNSDQSSGSTKVDLRSGRNQLLVVPVPASIRTLSHGVASCHLNACRTCFLSSYFRVWMAWSHDSRDEETGRKFGCSLSLACPQKKKKKKRRLRRSSSTLALSTGKKPAALSNWHTSLLFSSAPFSLGLI